MRLFEHAGAGETLMNAFIIMTITFAVLTALFLLMKVFTFVFTSVSGFLKQKQPSVGIVSDNSEDIQAEVRDGCEFSAGTLVLKDVDESTAAMIMAIVSDESGIPLERLIFRSIKLIK